MKRDYQDIFKQAQHASSAKANKLIDIIIKEKPYFHNPELYYMKIDCLKRLFKKNKITKQKYRREIKKNVSDFFFSYYINRDYVINHMQRNHFSGMASMIIEEDYDIFLTDKFKWQAAGFLNDIVEVLGIRDKSSYRQGDELIHHSLQQLWEIYTLYNCDEELIEQTEELMYAYWGHCYINWGEEDKKTIELFNESLAINPDNALALYGLGMVYYESEESKNIFRAVRCLLKAVENEIDEWRCYYLLGKIYVGGNRKKEALKYYERAINLYDEDDMRKLLLDICEDLGDMYDKLNLPSALQKRTEVSRQPKKSQLDFQANINLKGLPADVYSSCKRAADFEIDTLLDQDRNKLEEDSKKLLKQVEEIYSLAKIHEEYMRESLAANYMTYYLIVEHEINSKLFKPFKKTFYRKYNSYTFNPVTKEPFCVYMREYEWKLTIGQIIKIFKTSDRADIPEYYRELNNYIKYHSPSLLERNFTDKLETLNKANNNIKHQVSLRNLSYLDDFIYFRELVMGDVKNRGILHAVLKHDANSS
jgi:TPR repeat protein